MAAGSEGVKNDHFSHFAEKIGELLFLYKIDSRFVFRNRFRGFLHFFIILNDFDLPIPMAYWGEVLIQYLEKYISGVLVTWWKDVICKYK